MDDFPAANEIKTPVEVKSVYEKQKQKCLQKMKNQNRTTMVFFNEAPDEKLINELQDKGYLINYVLSYKDKKYSCSFTIINPNNVADNNDELFSFNLNDDSLKNILNTLFK